MGFSFWKKSPGKGTPLFLLCRKSTSPLTVICPPNTAQWKWWNFDPSDRWKLCWWIWCPLLSSLFWNWGEEQGWREENTLLTWILFRHAKFVSQWGKSFVSSDSPDHMTQPFDNRVSAGDVCERWPFDLGRNVVKVGNVLSAQAPRENMENSPSHSAHRILA